MFYDSIKTYYPKMTTISNTSWSSLNHIEIYDDHYYSSPDWFAQNSNKYDNTSRTGPKVYVGEYAVTSGGAGNGNLRCAIGESAFMTGFERNSDVVIMSSYAPLLGNLNNRQWNPDAIYYNSSDCYGTPSYYAQKMFSNNTGNKYIPIKDSLNTDAVLSYNGAIGVGTWVTRCQYDSVKVWSDDSVIIDENFDIDASGWDVYGGTWIVNDGVYEQTSLNTDCRSTIGNIDLPSYIYHLKAKKISGNEGFLIIFGYTDDNNFYWWNIGGWSNTLSAIEHAIDGSKGTITSVSYSVETNRWYDLKIEVKDDSAKCYLDGVLMHAISVGLKQLYNSCTIDTMNQDIYLKIVNFSDSDQPAEICMKNLPEDIILKGSIQTMTYSNPYSENSITNPERIAPSIQDFSSTSTGFQYTFPQNSVNIFHLYPQSDLFQLPDETFSIPENSDNGTIVGILSANGGSEYTYAILKASLEGVFEINDSTGEVLVKTSSLLNYELTPSVLLTVTARDRMNDTIPAARGTCIINLTDVNEKPTLVNNNYYAFANDSSGTTIGTIFLTDEDIGQNYSYSITSQSVENVLFIDPLTGDITINDDDALRAAVSETIVFSVHAFDDGSPSLSDDNEYTLKVMNTPSLVLEINSIINHDLVIFPNPAGGDIIVMIPEVKEDQYLKMVDFRGRIIYYQKVQTNPTKIETSDFTDGIYCIQVLSGSTITGIQNVVIQK
jgi:alpha-L-arabinofuranosidase